ncbi:4-hydroxythreonine-4-phosphate dehydrogenase [Balneicella halophila]|uniref:4-hydroxythreonine-4-phosphate dehydrogenase n=1 Tax=Balneicella halophila TaxID=1537566 RepID=A0A7L4UR33_BALHA|nr:4-hydroxythreonine-4-phosphate dehydrogenase PdxA [Balneicella halophila]PVX51062.1 4-hydroxythreonine-4-phosphate dehydrogenase [Balneicella halophila]
MEERVKVAITQGDINGISYEIILKSFKDKYLFNLCTPILYGSPKVLAYYKKVLRLERIPHNTIRHTSEAQANQINVIDCNDNGIKVELGQATKEAGMAALEALERATNDLKDGQLEILVTAPINKDTIQSDDFKFPGHTEYLTQRFGVEDTVMLMVQDNLRVAVVTGHIPLGKVAGEITKDKVFQKLRALNKALIYNFGIRKPKIAVLGLNPHAGDAGLLGNEEIEILQPVLEDAKAEGILAMGPYPADGFFGSGSFSGFDAILAMYHDQGLIPFKTLANKGGVNFTTGLPIVRTSPAHGTAYGIVGKNEASEISFKEAIYEAVAIYEERSYHEECRENSLKPKERPQRKSYRPKIT